LSCLRIDIRAETLAKLGLAKEGVDLTSISNVSSSEMVFVCAKEECVNERRGSAHNNDIITFHDKGERQNERPKDSSFVLLDGLSNGQLMIGLVTRLRTRDKCYSGRVVELEVVELTLSWDDGCLFCRHDCDCGGEVLRMNRGKDARPAVRFLFGLEIRRYVSIFVAWAKPMLMLLDSTNAELMRGVSRRPRLVC